VSIADQLQEAVLTERGRHETSALAERRIDFTPELETHGYIREPEKQAPFKDSDVLTLYHGFRDLSDAVYVAKHGLSGKDWPHRVYSYEFNNNPRGLFVTLSKKKAAEFAGGIDAHAMIEFKARYGELESPVWPGGSYTVQGQMSQSFRSKFDRVQAGKALRKQAVASAGKWDFVGKSDRPEVAQTLMRNGELQALFTGHLNPNRIARVWVREKEPDEGYLDTRQPFQPLARREFLKRFESKPDKSRPVRGLPDKQVSRLLRPQDEWDPDEFLKRLSADRGMAVPELLDALAAPWFQAAAKGGLDSWVWPKQLPQALRWLKRLERPK